MNQFSCASHCMVVLPVSDPVSFMIALSCSRPVEPSSKVRASDVLATATDTYPLIAASSFCKLLFVIVPHVPEFSPVVWSSRFRVPVYVEAIYSSYATSSIKAATIRFAVASPASPMSEEIACRLSTVVFGSLPNHDCSGPMNTPSARL